LQILFLSLNKAFEKDKMWTDFKAIMSYATDNNIQQVHGMIEKTLEWYFLYRSLILKKKLPHTYTYLAYIITSK